MSQPNKSQSPGLNNRSPAPRNLYTRQENLDLAKLVVKYFPQESWVQIAARHCALGYTRNDDQLRNHWRREARKYAAAADAAEQEEQEADEEEEDIKEEEENGVDSSSAVGNEDAGEESSPSTQMPTRLSVSSSLASGATNLKRLRTVSDHHEPDSSPAVKKYKTTSSSPYTPETIAAIHTKINHIKSHEIPLVLKKLNSLKAASQDKDVELRSIEEEEQTMEGKLMEIERRRLKVTASRKERGEEIEYLERKLEKKNGEVKSLEHAMKILGETDD